VTRRAFKGAIHHQSCHLLAPFFRAGGAAIVVPRTGQNAAQSAGRINEHWLVDDPDEANENGEENEKRPFGKNVNFLFSCA